jgi:hypothetical protein
MEERVLKHNLRLCEEVEEVEEVTINPNLG